MTVRSQYSKTVEMPCTESKPIDYNTITHKTEAVRVLCREKGFLRVMYGGGVTGILQWNDTDLHSRIEQAVLQLETSDFHQQLERRPWRVPTRERQDLLDDVGAIWASLPHASIGAQASKRTGVCPALPDVDGNGQVQVRGAEDSLVTREAAEFFAENRIPVKRAAALQEIWLAFQEGRLQSFWDIEALLEDFQDCSDGEHMEGEELEPPLLEDGASSGDSEEEPQADDDQDGDSPGDDDDAVDRPPGGAVPAHIVPHTSPGTLAPTSSAEAPSTDPTSAFAERVATTMASYDSAIHMATQVMNDPLAANFLRMRKLEAWKMLRRTDAVEEGALSEFLAKDREEMHVVREKLRAEDRARKDAKEKEKRADAAKKAEAMAKRAETARRERLAELSRTIPQAWSVNDFGQGHADNLPKKAIEHIREVLARMRLQSPEMPDDLAAQWPFFLDVAPEAFRRKWGSAIGFCFVRDMRNLLEHMNREPDAFHRFMRRTLRDRRGDVRI